MQPPNDPNAPRSGRPTPSVDGFTRPAPQQNQGLITDFGPQPAHPSPQPQMQPGRPAGAAPQAYTPRPTQPLSRTVPAVQAQPSAATTMPADDQETGSKPSHISFAKPEKPEIEPKEKTVQKSALHDVLSIVGVLVSALLLAFCLISFVFQSYQVDGPSMQTTLENNDHLIVWKVPKTVANITHHDYIPNRGDVIIFNEPMSDGATQNKQLIKRVIGLPGERVVVKDGIVTVYNKDRPDGFQPDKELPYGKVITTSPGNVDVTVKEGQVFVCGDNRTNSLDSRIFGPIDSDQIVGKLVLRVLPLNTIKTF